jgi:PilZ domain
MSDRRGASKLHTWRQNRREARRYTLDWQIRVAGEDFFEEAGELRNLSSSGALAYLKRAPELHSTMSLAIRLPLEAELWMKYAAVVVRVEEGDAFRRVAFRFDSPRPEFEEIKR